MPHALGPDRSCGRAQMPQTHRLLVACLLPVAVAAAWWLPAVLRGTYLADDYYLLSTLLDGGQVDWPRVRDQFAESWLFASIYWRPVFNLSLALNVAWLGDSARALLLVNLGLHLGVVFLTGWLCARVAPPSRAAWAALAGGLFCALHPVSAEPVLWVSARVTGLEVALRMVALVLFVAHLRRDRDRASLVLLVAASALALGAKESAVTLPAHFAALELVAAPRGHAWRDRLRTWRPIALLVVAYFGVRLAVLGQLGTPAPTSLGDSVRLTAAKLHVLLDPGAQGVAALLAWLGLAVLALFNARRERTLPALAAGAVLFAGWLLACLAPTYQKALEPALVGARMLYGALPVLALALTRAFASNRVPWLAAAVAIALGIWQLPTTGDIAARYGAAWRQMRLAADGVQSLGVGATPARPLAVLTMPPTAGAPGPMHPMVYYATAARPFVPDPTPVVGLGAVATRVAHSPGVLFDPTPVHAWLGAGGRVAHWSAAGAAMLAFTRGDAAPALTRDPATPDVARFRVPRAALAVEALEVRASLEAAGGVVHWLTAQGELPQLALRFAGGVSRDGQRIFTVDLTQHPPLLALALFGTELLGLRIELHQGALHDVAAAPRLAPLPLPSGHAPLQGEEVPWSDLGARLMAPNVTDNAQLHLWLVGEALCCKVPVQPGVPVQLPYETAASLRATARALRRQRYHYFFAATAPQGAPGSARSSLGWFHLGPP
ncbi:MAG: hypothetical protein AAF628_11315 [Planctomycetota bacterium]